MNDRETRVKVFKKDTEGNQICNTVFFTNYYVKLFFNAQHLMLQLQPYERCFFDFLCERMGPKDNNIFIGRPLKDSFLDFVKVIGGDSTKATNTGSTVTKLSKLGLLLSTNQTGVYIINPKYVYKGGEKARSAYLQQLIQTRINKNQPTEFLISVPEEQFLMAFKEEKKRW